MRLQPTYMPMSIRKGGNRRRPVRLHIGSDLTFDLTPREALALADALVDATENPEQSEETA